PPPAPHTPYPTLFRSSPFAHDLDVEALRAQQLCGALGGGLHIGLVEGVEADARDPGEVLEVGAHLRHQLAHAGSHGLDLVCGERDRKSTRLNSSHASI